jgi:hypothetical protein
LLAAGRPRAGSLSNHTSGCRRSSGPGTRSKANGEPRAAWLDVEPVRTVGMSTSGALLPP